MNIVNSVIEKVTSPFAAYAAGSVTGSPCRDVMVDSNTLGFEIPSFGDMLTFLVKGFFVVAGIAALVMLLWGALAWVISGGSKENVEAARDRITAALIGVFMILVALAIIWTLEQIVFKGTVCFGLSCPVTLPTLLEPAANFTPPPPCTTPTP